MTKQEEIFNVLQDVKRGKLSEHDAITRLHKLGVVIKVGKDQLALDRAYVMVAVEPLIEEV